MKKLFLSTAVLSMMAFPAFAQGNLGANANAYMHGSSATFAVSGGASFGNGSSLSEAGQFSATQGTMSGGLTASGNSASLNLTQTNESFTTGFDKSKVNGSALAGAIRGGIAQASGGYWANGHGTWGN